MDRTNRTEENKGHGNTEIMPLLRKEQAPSYQYWIFVWNNYEIEQIAPFLSILEHECEWYLFQEEKGESGTIHLQGTLRLKKRQRLTALKKWSNKIHWEPTKSISKSIVYSSKMETRFGKQWAKGIEIPREIKVCEPYGWQLEVMDIIKSEPDERTIHWFWEPNGKMGKSQLCKYLVVKHKALICSGKKSDIFHSISKNKIRDLIVLDLPRSLEDKFISYGAIEQIKNGLIFSGKYDSVQLVFPIPHVIVFANNPPDMSQMSRDRWHIVRISPQEGVSNLEPPFTIESEGEEDVVPLGPTWLH